MCLVVLVSSYTPGGFLDNIVSQDNNEGYANVYYKRSPTHKFTTYGKRASDSLTEKINPNMGGFSDYGWIF